MLKLKLQYFGHLVWRTDSLEKTLGKIEGRRRRDDRGWDSWMASLTWQTWVWANSWSWWLTGKPGVLPFMGLQRVRHDWATELNWTGYKINIQKSVVFLYINNEISERESKQKKIPFKVVRGRPQRMNLHQSQLACLSSFSCQKIALAIA